MNIARGDTIRVHNIEQVIPDDMVVSAAELSLWFKTRNIKKWNLGGVMNVPEAPYDFGAALELVKHGYRMARKGWNGRGMFIFLVPGSTFKVNRPPLLGIYPEGTEIKYHAHVDMKTADGMVVPWICSQTDMLAEDWVQVE